MSELLSYAVNHQELVYGFVAGWLLRNPAQVVRIVFNALVKIPGVHDFVVKNAPTIKAWVKEGEAELEKEIDEETRQ